MSGRIGPRIEDRSASRQLTAVPGLDVADEQPSGEGEGGDRAAPIDGVAGDPAGGLAGALAAGELVGWEGGRLVDDQLGGIGEQALDARRRVDQPQAVDRILTVAAAQEQDPLAGRRHLDVARLAQGEPLGPGVQPGEARYRLRFGGRDTDHLGLFDLVATSVGWFDGVVTASLLDNYVVVGRIHRRRC